MSDLCVAMTILKTIFEKHAGKEGDCKSLSRRELADLFHEELGVKDCDEGMDEFFAKLDGDGNNAVDFKEYIVFVAALAACMK